MSIRLFDKTSEGVVCPHFYILNWGRGCPFDCSYCYLALTHRLTTNIPRSYKWARIEKAIDKFFASHEEPSLLNTGELADSLMNPKLMEKICDKFEEQTTHKVLLLSKGGRFPHGYELHETKGSAIDFLYKKKYKQTVVSFSVNPFQFAELYEKGAPNIYDRLRAAFLLQHAADYEVRLRIDPIIPLKLKEKKIPSWKWAYRKLASFILKIMFVNPARITLGTPRWFPALPYWLKRAGRTDGFFENFQDTKEICIDGRYRLKNRVEAYAHLNHWLKKYGYKGPIGLCKETVDTWEQLRFHLGMLPHEIRCNCTL